MNEECEQYICITCKEECEAIGCDICQKFNCNTCLIQSWSVEWGEKLEICDECIKAKKLYMGTGDRYKCDYFATSLYYKTVEKYELEIEKLKAEIELLKTQIKFQPDGTGYVEAKEHFEELVKEN